MLQRASHCWLTASQSEQATALPADGIDDEPAALVWEDRSGDAGALVPPLAGSALSADGSDISAEDVRVEADGPLSDREDEDEAGGPAAGAEKLRIEASSLLAGPAGDEAAAEDESGAEPCGLQGAWEDRSGAGAGGNGPLAARRRPVWEDLDDARQAVNVAGRNRLRKLRAAEEERVLTGVHARVMAMSMNSLTGTMPSHACMFAAISLHRGHYFQAPNRVAGPAHAPCEQDAHDANISVAFMQPG